MTRPTPIHLKLLRGNPGKRAIRPELAPERSATCPEPPAFVAANGFASDEYWRVAPELARVGRLGPLDLMPFCAYCMLYSRWRTAEEAVARIAEGDGETHRLVVRTVVGDQRRNVLAKIAADAAADMVRFGAPFGLSPLSRARLSAGVDHEPPPGGKFDGPSPLRAPRHACPRSPPVRYKRDPLVEARVKCRRAYGRAETDVGLSALTVDRLCAETLTLQAGQRPESQAEMFERTRLLFELLHDRA